MAGAGFPQTKGIDMPSTRRHAVLAAALLASSTLFAPTSSADDRHHRHHDDKSADSYVGAAFGRGLNTAQPGNSVNHVILPKWIEVKAGGVVNFAHAGFHNIVIFKPGIRREDLNPFLPPDGIFIFPPDPTVAVPAELAGLVDHLYYRGINPAGGPPPGTPATAEPSNASNRSEPVAFIEPGVYLVICNVLPHLLDGMYAYVRVKRND
jgi:plastocyanin